MNWQPDFSIQVNTLLSSLEIDSDARGKGPLPGRFRELEDYWNESQSMCNTGPHPADGWVAEYGQHRAAHGDPDAWAHSFEQQHGANGWASEFERVRMSYMACVYLPWLIGHINLVRLATG